VRSRRRVLQLLQLYLVGLWRGPAGFDRSCVKLQRLECAMDERKPLKLKSKLVICNVPTVNSDAALRFYEALLGSDRFARRSSRNETYFHPLSPDGIDLTVTQRMDDREQWTCYFAVENLDQATAELRQLGGEMLFDPIEVAPLERFKGARPAGRFTVLLDPDRNPVGLIELSPTGREYYRAGDFQQPLADDQLSALEAEVQRSP